MMIFFELYQYFNVDIFLVCCYYIFCLLFDKVWVSDNYNNFSLIDIIGVCLFYLKDLCSGGNGLYILNSEGILFYIDSDYNIKLFLKDMKIIIIIIKIIDF